MIIEGVVNQPSNISFSDGADVKILTGKTAELLISGLHGNNYTLNYRGNLFHGYSVGQQAAIPITTTKAPNFILYNPRSNNVNAVLIDYCIGWNSGTHTEGNIQMGVLTDAPAAPATGASIAAFTNGTVLNGNLGHGNVNKVRFGSAATLTASATKFLPLGFTGLNFLATSDMFFGVYYKFDGTIIVSPGTAIFTCATAATVALYDQRITWYEFPV